MLLGYVDLHRDPDVIEAGLLYGPGRHTQLFCCSAVMESPDHGCAGSCPYANKRDSSPLVRTSHVMKLQAMEMHDDVRHIKSLALGLEFWPACHCLW
jgi:hypothetical protein